MPRKTKEIDEKVQVIEEVLEDKKTSKKRIASKKETVSNEKNVPKKKAAPTKRTVSKNAKNTRKR